MDKVKRILAFMLAVLMGVAFCPMKTVAVSDGDVVVLQQDVTEPMTITRTCTLDMNGFDIIGELTVAEGCVLYVRDSQTDDYTVEDPEGYGILAAYTGQVQACDGYIQVTEQNGISFHRVDMQIDSMTLRPESVGIYYNGSFYGDELVGKHVKCFGIALRIQQAPDAAYLRTSSACSRYYDFQPGVEGNTATGTLLHGVMRTGNTTKVNQAQAMLRIWGSTYLLAKDGSYYFGTAVGRSLLEQTQAADAQWKTLTFAQQQALRAMNTVYISVMENWYLPNLNDKDIDVPI